MPQKSQNRSSLQQTLTMQNSYSNTVEDATQSDDDDDNICLTCIGKCTCNNTSNIPEAATPSTPISQPQSSSLKIRLTVPPSLLSSLHTQSRVTSQSSKLKLTTSASAQDDESNTKELSPPTVKRKRGRPSKAETEARRTATIDTTYSVVSRNRLAAATNKIKATRKLNGKRQKLKSKHKSRHVAQKHFEFDSNTSESEGEDGTPVNHYRQAVKSFDPEGARHDHTGLDSDLSELSSLPDPGDESSLEAEEERYIIQETTPRNNDKSRVRRELFGDENNQRRFDRTSQQRHSWEFRTSQRSRSISGGDTTSDSDTESEENDTAGQEGDEEDADGDEDADTEDHLPTFLPMRTGIWSDVESTEGEFDADLFFASLSDSDTSTAEFEHVFRPPQEDEMDEEHEDVERMDVIQVDDTFGTGLLGSFTSNETTVLVSRDFNGQPLFTNGSDFTMGMLDLDFELNIVAQARTAAEQSGTFPSTTSNGEDDEMWIASETEEADLESDHGDTTDDDISVIKGIQTASGVVMFRFPTPPISSINPMSTLSPMPKKTNKISSAKKRKAFEKSQHRHLTIQTTKLSELKAKSQNSINSPQDNDDAASDSGQSSSLSSSKRQPTMGRFNTQHGPTMHHVIINGDGKNLDIPSPISPSALNRARARARRDSGSSRGRKRGSIRNVSPVSSLSRRHDQSPVSSRSISTDTRTKSSNEASETSVAAPPVTPIELDEVLDSSFIDPFSNEIGIESEIDYTSRVENKYFERWDRVPMGAFRQSRYASISVSETNNFASVMEWAPNQPATVSDGFCYGSPGGSLMRSRTLPFIENAELEPTHRRRSSLHQSHLASPTAQKRRAPEGESGREGDRTPTGSRPRTDAITAFGNTPEEEPMPKILSHKARRKAKRILVSSGEQ